MQPNSCFVIGNGPSLSVTPLDDLAGVDSFAVNRINQIFPRFRWRPTYYVRTETPTIDAPEHWWTDIAEVVAEGIECYMPFWDNSKIGPKPSNVHWVNTCHHYKYLLGRDKSSKIPHSWHLPLLCDYGSSLSTAIQLAVQKGYKVIFLLGCDLGYKDSGTSHFYQDNPGYRISAELANRNILHAHEIAKRECEERGVEIYNATIGGELEIYERVDLCQLLSKEKLG